MLTSNSEKTKHRPYNRSSGHQAPDPAPPTGGEGARGRGGLGVSARDPQHHPEPPGPRRRCTAVCCTCWGQSVFSPGGGKAAASPTTLSLPFVFTTENLLEPFQFTAPLLHFDAAYCS